MRFVVEIVGEICSSDAVRRRRRRYEEDNRTTYFYTLDGAESSGNPYSIDATEYGNVSRLINRSCDSNLMVRRFLCDNWDRSVHRIALFAEQPIYRGEELFVNYGVTGHGDNGVPYHRTERECNCGAENCLRYQEK